MKRIFVIILILFSSIGISIGYENCIVDSRNECVYENGVSIINNNGLLLGIEVDNKVLFNLLDEYKSFSGVKINIYNKKNVVEKNFKAGKHFSVIVSSSSKRIKDQLIDNGFADWMFNIRINNEYFAVTIPYQNINRAQAVKFLEFLLDKSIEDKKICSIVFYGNREKLDSSLVSYAYNVISGYN